MPNTWCSTADGLDPPLNKEGVPETVRLMTRSGIVLGNYYRTAGLYFDENLTPVVVSHYQVLEEGER